MSKELEALERLKTAPSFMGGTAEYQACTQSEALLMQDYEIVRQALLKAQDNARSEETLQKYFQEGITLDSVRALKQEKDYYKKVLEIIKEKNVAVALLKSCRTVNAYNILAFDDEYLKANNYLRKLTQEEFNLLKEVLE